MASTQYTCITCRVGFESSEAQRGHYKADWHRYNLKRKVAGMTPVSVEAFRQKVQDQKELAAKQANEQTFSAQCEVCAKKFGSENAQRNHFNSKKHKELVKRRERAIERGQPLPSASSSSSTSNKGTASVIKDASEAKFRNPAEEYKGDDDDEDEEMEELDDAKPETTTEPADGELGDPSDREYHLNECLFCSFSADTLEDSLAHMGEAHTFFIPDLTYLTDLEGLMMYLHEKVHDFFVCLKCNGVGRSFYSLEGVRKHMLDKGHTQLDYSDTGAAELSDFFDFTASYPEWEDVSDDDGEDDDEGEVIMVEGDEDELDIEDEKSYIDHSTLEIVLPGGARLGHRDLNRYYKQRAQPEDNRDSVVIGRLLSRYKSIGYDGHMELTSQHQRDRKKMIHHAQKSKMKLGMKANKLQTYFREQVLQ